MLRKIIFIPLFILAVALFFLALLGFSLKFTILNPEFIKRELNEQKVYEKVYANLPEIINEMTESHGEEEVGNSDKNEGPPFSAEEMTRIVQKSVFQQELQQKFEYVINSFWQWFLGKRDKLEINVPLKENKDRALIELQGLFKAKFEALPICKTRAEAERGGFSCRPKGITFEDAMNILWTEPNSSTPSDFLKNIPDNFEPYAFAQENPEFAKVLKNIENARQKANIISKLLYIGIPVFLLFAILLLARLFTKEWGKIPQVLGTFLIILSILTFIINFVGLKIGLPKILELVNRGFANFPFLKDQLIIPLIKDVYGNINNVLNLEIFAFLTLGILIILVSWLTGKVFQRMGNR